MKTCLRLLLIAPLFLYLASCSNGGGKNKLYYYSIVKQKSKEHKDSLFAANDEAAVDSTLKHYYTELNEYELERAKLNNNPYLDRPMEWHLMTTDGNFVTSVDEDDIKKIEAKYKTTQ